MISGINQISTLPTVYAKVNELVDNPTSSASDLGRVISRDQGLTARLLKLVNSAFYGLPSKIDTVSRAVTVIGFKQLKELVLATSVLSMFKGLGSSISLSMEDFWKHSIACGLTSRILAIYARCDNPEAFFVAGLLHDLGRLVLLEKCSEEYKNIFHERTEKDRMLFEVERSFFGYTHAEVARELVSFWNLPETLKSAVGFHHVPQRAGRFAPYAGIVHIADIFVHACEIGASGEHYVPNLFPEAWNQSGLKRSILEPAIDKIHEQFEEAYSFVMGAVEK
jgi:HD-like signal output (HDOD) protein